MSNCLCLVGLTQGSLLPLYLDCWTKCEEAWPAMASDLDPLANVHAKDPIPPLAQDQQRLCPCWWLLLHDYFQRLLPRVTPAPTSHLHRPSRLRLEYLMPRLRLASNWFFDLVDEALKWRLIQICVEQDLATVAKLWAKPYPSWRHQARCSDGFDHRSHCGPVVEPDRRSPRNEYQITSAIPAQDLALQYY